MDQWQTKGPQVCAWIESMLVHGEGDVYGQPFRLRADQRLFIYRWYEHENSGRWRYDRAYLQQPKGAGKTELGAALGLAEFCGPAAPAGTPNIPVGAASFEQANLLYGRARQMCTHEASPLAPYIEAYDTELMFRDGRPGRMYRVAAEAGTQDGGLPTLFLADEVHEWTGKKARVHLVISNGLTKRTPPGRNLNLSTPGSYNTINDTPAGLLHQKGLKIQSGEDEAGRYLFSWTHADPSDYDLSDPVELEEATRVANPSASDDRIEALIDRYAEIPEHEYARYHLANWLSSTDRWLPAGLWDALPTQTLSGGEDIVLGFDGSYSGDSTALVACSVEDPCLVLLGLWERPEEAREGWVVPREAVSKAVADAFQRFNVRVMACDPPGWHREIDEWADTYGETVVIHWATNVRKRMAEACSRFFTSVSLGEIAHDHDPSLSRHLDNCVTKDTPQGTLIVKDVTSKKIDAAVAAVVAYNEACVVGDEPPEPQLNISFL